MVQRFMAANAGNLDFFSPCMYRGQQLYALLSYRLWGVILEIIWGFNATKQGPLLKKSAENRKVQKFFSKYFSLVKVASNA